MEKPHGALTLEIFMDAVNKARTQVYEKRVEAILLSKLFDWMVRTEYEGKQYIIMHPNKMTELQWTINKFPNIIPPGNVAYFAGIPVYEDDELVKKIVLAALTK